MSDEAEFLRALSNAKNYNYIDIEFKILHPLEPNKIIPVDNISIKENILFVFEGKRNKLEEAVSQLKIDYLSFRLYRETIIKSGKLLPYNNIRLFYYSLKRGLLIEFDKNGRELSQYRFDKRGINQLTEILRKL